MGHTMLEEFPFQLEHSRRHGGFVDVHNESYTINNSLLYTQLERMI